MKTLIEKSTLISNFIFQDNDIIERQEDHWRVGSADNVQAKIWDCDLILIESLTEPTNYRPAKYKVIDGEWVLNPFYLASE